MHKPICLIALLLASVSFASAQDCKPKKMDATVEQQKGIFIFVDSRPSAEYDFLGTVSAGSGLSKAMIGASEYSDKKNKLVKKAVEKYPNADGIVIHFVSGGKDTADAIKFK